MDISTENKTSEIKFYKFNDNPDETPSSSEPTDKKNDIKNDNMLELTLDDIFINLTLISKIEVGNKLFNEDKYINIDNSYFPSITRWFYGNNRKTSINFISQILSKSFEYFSELIIANNSESSKKSLRLNSDLKNSINGLTNLKLTYNYDKLIQSEIDVMIDNIRSKIDFYFKNANSNSLINTQTIINNKVLQQTTETKSQLNENNGNIPFHEKREKKEKKIYPVIYNNNNNNNNNNE
jgi:hypothetical protein